MKCKEVKKCPMSQQDKVWKFAVYLSMLAILAGFQSFLLTNAQNLPTHTYLSPFPKGHGLQYIIKTESNGPSSLIPGESSQRFTGSKAGYLSKQNYLTSVFSEFSSWYKSLIQIILISNSLWPLQKKTTYLLHCAFLN